MTKIEIQYQTHQVLTNKNRQTEMNHQLLKIETPHDQTTQSNNTELTLIQKNKKKLENLKRIINEKTNLPLLRNIEWRTVKKETEKINQVLTHISTNNITELNELIYEGAKLVCEKIGLPLKKHEKKPGWEFRLKTQMKNLRK